MEVAVCVMLMKCFCCNINELPPKSAPSGYEICAQECNNINIEAIVSHPETLFLPLNDNVHWHFPDTKTRWEKYSQNWINAEDAPDIKFSPKLVKVNKRHEKYSGRVVDERVLGFLDVLALKRLPQFRKKRDMPNGPDDMNIIADVRDMTLSSTASASSLKSWYGFTKNGYYGKISVGTDIEGGLMAFKYTVDGLNGALTVSNAEKDDAGRYLCYSWDINAVTDDLYITWAQPQKCSVTGVLLYNEGDDMELHCAVNYFGVKPGKKDTLPQIVWYHGDNIISEGVVSQQTTLNTRLEPILSDDVSVVSKLTISADNAMDGTTIECKYRLKSEEPEVQLCAAIIDVTPTPPTALEYPSHEIIFPSDEPTTSVQLNCRVDPNEVRYHMWRGYTPRLDAAGNSRISINERITSLVNDFYFVDEPSKYGLLIPNASLEDTGKYICSDFFRGDIGSANIIAVVPGDCQSDSTIRVVAGTNFEITCSAEIFGTVGSDLQSKLTILQDGETLGETYDTSEVNARQMTVAVTEVANAALDRATISCTISIEGLLDSKELCKYTLAVQDRGIKKQDNDSCLATPGLCLTSNGINLCDCADDVIPGAQDSCLPIDQCEMLDDFAWEGEPKPICLSLEDEIIGECEDDDLLLDDAGAYNCTDFDMDADDEPCIESLEKVEFACECLPGYKGDGLSCHAESV